MRTEKTAKQRYIENLISENPLQQKARQDSEELNKEGISLSPVEAQMLKVIAASVRPHKIVEIGTLTGLSALYLAEAVAENKNGGTLWSVEKDETHYQRAKNIFVKFMENQKGCQLNAIQGDAREELEKLTAQGVGPFCVIFIDANKAAYMDYLNWALKNIRNGGLIIADNVFLSGAVWGSNESAAQKFNKKQVQVMQEFNQTLMHSPDYLSTLIPTEEGLLVSLKKN